MKLNNIFFLVVVQTASTTKVNTTQACDIAGAQDAFLGAACKSLGDQATPIIEKVKSCASTCTDEACRQKCAMDVLSDPAIAQNITQKTGLPANITEETTSCAKKCGQNLTCASNCANTASLSSLNSPRTPSSSQALLVLSQSSPVLLSILATLAFSLI